MNGVPGPYWDSVESFKEFLPELEEQAPFHTEVGVEDVYDQVMASPCNALLLLEDENMTIWPEAGGFIRLRPDGTWVMDIAPFAG